MARDITTSWAHAVAAVEPRDAMEPADAAESFLEVAGLEGSCLRASRAGLTVVSCPTSASSAGLDERFWPYEQIRSVRVDEYGALGVVRAIVRTSGEELPLLLLEPEQITSARRVLEMVWNLMAAHVDRRIGA